MDTRQKLQQQQQKQNKKTQRLKGITYAAHHVTTDRLRGVKPLVTSRASEWLVTSVRVGMVHILIQPIKCLAANLQTKDKIERCLVVDPMLPFADYKHGTRALQLLVIIVVIVIVIKHTQ
jgi:hypothetical protein